MSRRFFYDFEFMEEPGFLEMISIGVVGEDNSEFYAINLDADMSRANEWVRKNVICKLPDKGDIACGYNPAWKRMPEIRSALLDFLKPSKEDPVELWGYYADYDHVLLCWIFGMMIDLPKGMPWYTLDIKQEMFWMNVERSELPKDPDGAHNALIDARWNKHAWECLQKIKEQRRL